MDEITQDINSQEQPEQPLPQNNAGNNGNSNNSGNNGKSGSDGGLAVAALVCGILGIVGSFIPIVQYFTIILSILGIIFGVKARKTAPPEKRGMATAGMVLGIIALALGILGIICVVCLAGAALSGLGAF